MLLASRLRVSAVTAAVGWVKPIVQRRRKVRKHQWCRCAAAVLKRVVIGLLLALHVGHVCEEPSQDLVVVLEERLPLVEGIDLGHVLVG